MTNYEKVMNEMTPEKLAEIIANPCLTCAYREKEDCLFQCIEGIEKWLKHEEEKDETD